MPEGPTLAQLGEWELIRRLGAFAPAHQFEDDAALLELGPGTPPLVVNTDVLVEGVHFSAATTGPEDVGWRAAAANLSDLAAMGCLEGLGLTVGLVAPPLTPWSWVEGVYGGLAAALERHGGQILGGDCSSGSQCLLAVTALGRLPAGAGGAIRRCDGRPGDRLISTGPHGLSRLGLALLRGEQAAEALAPVPQALRDRAVAAHRRPRPRFDAVAALVASRPAGNPWRVGGCDSSDGLAAAVAAVAAASGCGARLERGSLPMEPAMAELAPARAWCLGGGEDFELVLALEPRWAEALVAALPEATAIGSLVAAADAGPQPLLWSDGAELGPEAAGFTHFM